MNINRINTKKIILLVLFLTAAFSAWASGNPEKSGKNEPAVRAFVSIMPQKWFVERIGGGRVSVEVLVGPGRSPATYEPSPNQTAALSGADVFFTIGVPFERAFLSTVESSLRGLMVSDLSMGIEKRRIEDHGHEGEAPEAHGHEDHQHAEEAPDPHVWLSPAAAKIMAENVYKTLLQLDPAGSDIYDSGLNSLLNDLDKLDAEIERKLKPFAGRTVFVFHPSLGYFTDRYGLKQAAIETGGKTPNAAQLGEIINHAREDRVKLIFVQPEFSKKSAAVIAEAIGGRVAELNVLSPDYINNLNKIADEVRRACE